MGKKVLIGIPSASGLMPIAMVQSLLQLKKSIPCAFICVERQRTDKARNAIAMEALEKDFDYLLFVDDDNPIPPETLELFLEDDKDIVVAPILGRNPTAEGKFPLCAFYERKEQGVRLYHPIEDFKDEGPLHKIDAGGTGCMLIKKEVLEKLFKKFKNEIFAFTETIFDKKVNIDGKEYEKRTMSEDVEFCERARDMGFEVWLDERIRPLHITRYNTVQWKPRD